MFLGVEVENGHGPAVVDNKRDLGIVVSWAYRHGIQNDQGSKTIQRKRNAEKGLAEWRSLVHMNDIVNLNNVV